VRLRDACGFLNYPAQKGGSFKHGSCRHKRRREQPCVDLGDVRLGLFEDPSKPGLQKHEHLHGDFRDGRDGRLDLAHSEASDLKILLLNLVKVLLLPSGSGLGRERHGHCMASPLVCTSSERSLQRCLIVVAGRSPETPPVLLVANAPTDSPIR